MAVFREKQSIVSVQLPIILENNHRYQKLAQVLCPFVGNDTDEDANNKTQEVTGNETKQRAIDDDTKDSLTVEISSASSTPVEYVLNATLLDDFDLRCALLAALLLFNTCVREREREIIDV